KAQEVKAGLNLGIIKMELDDSELDEITVSGGYYTTTSKMKTGSISKITSEEIRNQPVTSPLMALQGRVPGLDITPVSGAPGAAMKVQIRGQNSLRQGASIPLYVIDGVPIDSRPVANSNSTNTGTAYHGGLDPLSMIDPDNIES